MGYPSVCPNWDVIMTAVDIRRYYRLLNLCITDCCLKVADQWGRSTVRSAMRTSQRWRSCSFYVCSTFECFCSSLIHFFHSWEIFFKISLIGQKLIQRLLVCYVCDESSNFPNGSLFFPISSDFQIVSFLHSGWSWKQFWKQSSVISSCKNLHITLHLTVWVLINVRLHEARDRSGTKKQSW